MVANAPSGKAVVMFDSGTSYTFVTLFHFHTSTLFSYTCTHRYAPKDVCDALYSGVQGAAYNSDLGMWVVPCDAEVDIALQLGYV